MQSTVVDLVNYLWGLLSPEQAQRALESMPDALYRQLVDLRPDPSKDELERANAAVLRAISEAEAKVDHAPEWRRAVHAAWNSLVRRTLAPASGVVTAITVAIAVVVATQVVRPPADPAGALEQPVAADFAGLPDGAASNPGAAPVAQEAPFRLSEGLSLVSANPQPDGSASVQPSSNLFALGAPWLSARSVVSSATTVIGAPPPDAAAPDSAASPQPVIVTTDRPEGVPLYPSEQAAAAWTPEGARDGSVQAPRLLVYPGDWFRGTATESSSGTYELEIQGPVTVRESVRKAIAAQQSPLYLPVRSLILADPRLSPWSAGSPLLPVEQDVPLRKGPGLAASPLLALSADSPVYLDSASAVRTDGHDWVACTTAGGVRGFVTVEALRPAEVSTPQEEASFEPVS